MYISYVSIVLMLLYYIVLMLLLCMLLPLKHVSISVWNSHNVFIYFNGGLNPKLIRDWPLLKYWFHIYSKHTHRYLPPTLFQDQPLFKYWPFLSYYGMFLDNNSFPVLCSHWLYLIFIHFISHTSNLQTRCGTSSGLSVYIWASTLQVCLFLFTSQCESPPSRKTQRFWHRTLCLSESPLCIVSHLWESSHQGYICILCNVIILYVCVCFYRQCDYLWVVSKGYVRVSWVACGLGNHIDCAVYGTSGTPLLLLSHWVHYHSTTYKPNLYKTLFVSDIFLLYLLTRIYVKIHKMWLKNRPL